MIMLQKGNSFSQDSLDQEPYSDHSIPMTRNSRMTSRINTQGYGLSANSSFSSAGPSTPSSSFVYRRPSTASSISWEPGLSGHSSVMSQRSSGPSTPKREEEFSPIDLFMTESQHYSGPAMPNVLSHQDLGEALMLDGCQTGLMATHSSKPFPEYDYGDTLSSYGNPAGSLNQEMQTTIAPSAAYQNLSFGYGSYHPYSDFSSPMGSAFTSPVAERPPPTIMPSQTIVSFSAADRALSFYDLKTESSDDSELMGSYNSFTTPSPSCSPTRYDSSSSRSIRTSRSSNSMQVLRTPETPTRDRTLGSTHRITKTCRTTYRKANIDGQPLIVFGEDAKPHACQEVPGCKRRFKRQEHLKRHEKTHRNDKPYVCPIPKCERAFNRQDNLKAHKTTHKKPGGRNVYVKDFVD